MFSLLKRPVFWLIITPFVLLGLVFFINPLLTTANYCSLPTWFETGHGVFPAIISQWYVYVFLIIIAEIILGYLWLLLSGLGLLVFLHRKEQAKRRLFLSVPFIALLAAAFLLVGGEIILDVFGMYRYQGLYTGLLIGVSVLLILATSIWLFVVSILQYRREDKTHRLWKGTLASSLLIAIPALLLPVAFFVTTGLSNTSMTISPPNSIADSVVSENIGLSVGGANDVDNFRENIENCFLPAPTDITYEGLFYDYAFDTQNKTNCSGVFCPQYESAVLEDPFSRSDEYYLSVGLGSNISQADFDRPPLNLVIVLDISGSMTGSFDRYYYDRFRNRASINSGSIDWDKQKMEAAKEAISGVVKQLRPEDRLGVVTFNGSSQTVANMQDVSERSVDEVVGIVNRISAYGGTNMEAGIKEGTRLFMELSEEEKQGRENRIIFLTDAQPNTGSLDKNELYKQANENAESGLHTTFFGIGVDFNTRLIEAITNNLRGANYFAVHSPTDFERRLNEEFEYFSAPLAYNVSLSISEGDYEIENIYGSPEAASSSNEVLRVKTLFPSPTTEGESKGGVILAQMDKQANTGTPTLLNASYETRDGIVATQTQAVRWGNNKPSENLRKAVLLSQFAKLMKNWLADEHARGGPQEKTIYVPVRDALPYYQSYGLPELETRRVPERSVQYVEETLSEWERLSRRLAVSEDYKDTFRVFLAHYQEVAADIGDDTLEQEREIIENLINAPAPDRLPQNDTNTATFY